ncbi:hypothetical protein EDB80DRAFT_128110 [Ilyonectria destructans]|nr:hypothetical protein EDB80DRAFT_128110 [Ilyonectria destructans]
MELEVGEAVSLCTECFAPLYFLAATRRHAHGHRHSPVQCAYIPSPKSCTPTQTHHQLSPAFRVLPRRGARSVVDVERTGFLSTPRRNQKRIRRFASGNCTTSCWAHSWLALRAIGLARSPRTLGFNDAVHQKKPAFDPFPGPVIQSHVCRSVRSGAAGAVLEQLLHQMFPSPSQTRLTSTPPPLQRPILRPTGQSVQNAPVASLGVTRACLGLLGLPLGVPGALHDPQQRRPFLGAPMAPIRVAVCTKRTWPYHRTPVSPSPHPLRRRASFPRRAKGGCGDSGGLQL